MTSSRVREAVAELQPTLPEGVRIVPFYDCEDLVRRVIRTVETNLLEGDCWWWRCCSRSSATCARG